MLLKRKRSEDELSTFSSSGIGYSSPMRPETGDVVMMDIDSPISPRTCSIFSPGGQNRSRSCTPCHLPSRTFKRLRNGRPSEEEVHQNTLKMLYQAQQQPRQPQHVFSPSPQAVFSPSMPSPQSPPTQNQPSLHSFWKIPTTQPPHPAAVSPTFPPSAAISPRSLEVANNPTACEDCGVALSEEDSMMDDGYGFETYINACSTCSRAVCFSCSVSNLGEQRRCLMCAGTEKKGNKWIGGVGWVSGSVRVC